MALFGMSCLTGVDIVNIAFLIVRELHRESGFTLGQGADGGGVTEQLRQRYQPSNHLGMVVGFH